MQQGAKPQDAADKAFKRVEEIFAKYPVDENVERDPKAFVA